MKMPLLMVMSVMLVGCGLMPHKAEFITERKVLAKANLEANGILAFEVANHTSTQVEVDFLHQESQKKYRVNFSPSFNNSMGFAVLGMTVAEKTVSKDVVSDSVALYQLPAGTYRPTHIYSRADGQDQTGGSATGSALQIFAGKITSIGRLEIDADKVLLLFQRNLRIESGAQSIDPSIRRIKEGGVSEREIVPARLRVGVK